MAKHLPFGGSTINRTLHCAGWRQLADQMPPSPSSSFADEGTLLHDTAEELFMDDPNKVNDPSEYIGREYNGIVLTEELCADKLQPALRGMATLMLEYEIDEFDCEPFVQMTEDAGGSIDMIGLSQDKKTVLIADYKFGFNQVEVEKNAQLMFYALCGAFDKATSDFFEKCERIVLAIVQPADGLCTPAVYEMSYDALDAFEDRVMPAIEACKQPNPEYTAGSWCRYCPGEGICPVKSGAVAAALRIDSDQVSTLAEALPLADQLESWIAAVRKLAHEQLEQGVPIPGVKLVAKRATKKYTDADAVEKMVKNSRKIKKEDAFKTSLITPAQMIKLFKAKGVDDSTLMDYIESVSSGTTLAQESDPRPDATPTAALKALADRL